MTGLDKNPTVSKMLKIIKWSLIFSKFLKELIFLVLRSSVGNKKLPRFFHHRHTYKKVLLNQQKFRYPRQIFSLKYESMVILFKLIKKKYCWFCLQFQQKKFVSSAKKWICKLKLQNYCTIKEKILLIEIKLKKFCKKY